MGKGAQAEGQALALAATEPLAASEPSKSNAADDKVAPKVQHRDGAALCSAYNGFLST